MEPKAPRKKVLTCTELRSGYKEHSVPHRHTTEAVYVRPNVHQLRAWGRGLRTASVNEDKTALQLMQSVISVGFGS